MVIIFSFALLGSVVSKANRKALAMSRSLAVQWDVIRNVKDCFDAEGVTIPYPQRDVHVDQEHKALPSTDSWSKGFGKY